MNNPSDGKWLHLDTWQRVVDGELTCAELTELVEVCQRRPELWEHCAMAFLEEQALQLELQRLAGNWPATPAEVVTPRPPLRGDAPSRRAARLLTAAYSQGLSYVALAASVVLAFLIGWQASQRIGNDKHVHWAAEAEQTSSVGNSSVAKQTLHSGSSAQQASQSAASQADGAPVAHQTQLDAALTANLPGTADAIELALERPEQFVPLDRRIPKPLADLEQRGLVRIQSVEGFVPVRLRDGNTAVVPVQQIDLRPVRNAY